jgi:hypothetical protein
VCKFIGTQVGDTVQFDYDGWTCDGCGCVESDKERVEGVYMGHVASKRYGVCDHILRNEPITCKSCGKPITDIYLPCGNLRHGLFERSKVEVEREGQRIR